MLPELPTFAQFFLKEEEEEEEEKLAFEEEDSKGPWDEERMELFFRFFPELKLVLLLLLLAPVLPPMAGLGMAGAEEISLGLKEEEDLVVLLLLLEEEERDFSARPEAREGAEEDEDKWAEGICGDEDTCRACVVP